MTLQQLQNIFESQLGRPELYYMIQTPESVSVLRHNMSTGTLEDLLQSIGNLEHVPGQGTYPLFK